MNLPGFILKSKPPSKLEVMASEALRVKGIQIVSSISFLPLEDYGEPVLVVGIGKTTNDYQGALDDFKANLPDKRPAYAISLRIGQTSIGQKQSPQLTISAKIYTQTTQ